jgi:hypothetical protein
MPVGHKDNLSGRAPRDVKRDARMGKRFSVG